MTIEAGTTAGTGRTALVVGATGIAGSALVDTLAGQGLPDNGCQRAAVFVQPGDPLVFQPDLHVVIVGEAFAVP